MVEVETKNFLFFPHPCDLNPAFGNEQWQLSIAAVATANWRQSGTSDLPLLIVAYSEKKTISFRAGGRNQVEFHEFTPGES